MAGTSSSKKSHNKDNRSSGKNHGSFVVDADQSNSTAYELTADTNVRHRKGPSGLETEPLLPDHKEGASDINKKNKQIRKSGKEVGSERTIPWKLLIYVVTVLSFATRFYQLQVPPEVVFDEVHFGKFASLYLKRKYYFDVHPPLGKLLFAVVGYFIGYDGHFNFDKIGDDYISNKVPFVQMRAWSAFCGAMIAPLAIEIVRELGFSIWGAFLAGFLIVFDNALITQSRFILLDSMLMLFMTMCLFSYIKFMKQRRIPFSRIWWKWLILSGVSLGMVTSVKLVGLLTVASVGVSVLIDLWYYLDYRKTTLRQFIRHFSARVLGLILVPLMVYLLSFYIHFAVLTNTGPGDDFMTAAFQSTLIGNKMSMESTVICYGANITMKQHDIAYYLHSHTNRYPLKYADGRVSSQGQQVTGYPHQDNNNKWRIYPADMSPEDYPKLLDPNSKPRPVKNRDSVILEHVMTKSHLLTHDVASPLTPTNQEFTTVKPGVRYNETLFRIEFDKGKPGDNFKTLGINFRLIHVQTGVALYTSINALPEWAFKQKEVNGNKKVKDPANMWVVEDAENVNPSQVPKSDSTIERPSFLSKFVELNSRMIIHNAILTKKHPYQSPPNIWPFVISGISFWQNNHDRQIYLLGNAIGWWLTITLTGVFFVGYIMEAILRRRNSGIIDSDVAKRMHFGTGFLFIAYLFHYVPFFFMGRSLFLHHYLPAVIITFILAGTVYDFALKTMFNNYKLSKLQTMGANAVTAVFVLALAWNYYLFVPLIYGSEGLTIPELRSRKWLDTWGFQYSG